MTGRSMVYWVYRYQVYQRRQPGQQISQLMSLFGAIIGFGQQHVFESQAASA